MQGTIISIPYRPDPEKMYRSLKIDEENRDEFLEVFEKCIRIACPKAAFSLKSVSCDDEGVMIGSERFTGKILYRNFSEAGVHRAFVYAVTCGRELYELALETEDLVERWWIDWFSQKAMQAADAQMIKTLKEQYRPGRISRMNPGSLEDFPITCQRGLFQLLEEETTEIGLELTSSCLMLPCKSGSGIIYETEKDFVSCMLCPREKCPERRAAYDEMRLREYEDP